MAECAAYKTLLEDDGVHPVPNIIVASEDSDDNNAAPSKRSRIREALVSPEAVGSLLWTFFALSKDMA